jgi:NAD(P)H-hydrate epimerase
MALSLAEASDVIAVGPGLGRSAALSQLMLGLLSRCARPMVLDADGLNNLGDASAALKQRAGPVVITPHPGEFARLIKAQTAQVQAQRRELAAALALECGIVVVLKGHATVVTDGRRLYCNTTGNPGMATAGSGDVLTGLIAALLGQGLEPFAAAQLGVYLHGLAGDLARTGVGDVGLIAADLIEYLPTARRQYVTRRRVG